MGGLESQCAPCTADTEEEEYPSPTCTTGHHVPAIPSAIHGGNCWEPPEMPETPLPDIEIKVTYCQTNLSVQDLTVTAALKEAKNLGLIDAKIEMKRSTSKSPPESFKKYTFRLQSYASTWRLKAAVAELSGCPSKFQLLLCDGMTEESCKEKNRPATLLTELPVYEEPTPPEPKLKPLPDPLTIINNPSFSDSEHEETPMHPKLNLVVLVPNTFPSPSEAKDDGKEEDAAVNKSGVKLEESNPKLSHPNKGNRMQPGYSEEDQSDRSSGPNLSVPYNRSPKPQKSPQETLKTASGSYQVLIKGGTPTGSAGKSAGDSESEEEADEPDVAQLVFHEMNIVTKSADLLQVTVGLSNFGYEGLELEQAKKLFKAMGCQISDKITINHLREFLNPPSHREDPWLTGVRKAIIAQVCPG